MTQECECECECEREHIMNANENKPALCIGMCIFNNVNGVSYLFSNLARIYSSNIFSRVDFVFIHEQRDPTLCEITKLIYDDFSLRVPNAKIEMIQNTYPRESVRQRNIGHARNTFLDYLRLLRTRTLDAEHACSFSHFAFMDFNDYACIGDINTDVLQEVMDLQSEWDSVSFMREAGYYDMWALSFYPYVHSFFHFIREWRDVLGRMRKMFDSVVLRAMHSGNPFLSVYSAFNGFALYRCSTYLSDTEPRIRYSDDIQTVFYPPDALQAQLYLVDSQMDGRMNNDCEHRYFHMVSAQPPHNARIYIYLKSLFKKMPPDTVSTLTYTPRAPV